MKDVGGLGFASVSAYLDYKVRTSNEVLNALRGLENEVREGVFAVLVSDLNNILMRNGLPSMQHGQHNQKLA